MNTSNQERLLASMLCASVLTCALLICWLGPKPVRADELTPAPTVIFGLSTAVPVTVKTGANLRGGPGTSYPRTGGAGENNRRCAQSGLPAAMWAS